MMCFLMLDDGSMSGISIKDWLGPLATVCASVAVVGTAFWYNRNQLRLTREKLRLDLFDRRLAILNAAINAYRLWAAGTQDEVKKANVDLTMALNSCEYLFPKTPEILEIMDKLHQDLIGYSGLVKERGNLDMAPFISKKIADISRDAPLLLMRLKDAIRPFMEPDSY